MTEFYILCIILPDVRVLNNVLRMMEIDFEFCWWAGKLHKTVIIYFRSTIFITFTSSWEENTYIDQWFLL